MTPRHAPVFALLLACGKGPDAQQPPVAQLAPAKPDAAPATAASSSASPALDATALVTPPPPVAAADLPSGDYEITTEVRRDTCSAAVDGGAAGPEPMTQFVAMKVVPDRTTGKDRFIGNFPLPMPRGRFAVTRSDITIDPAEDGKPATIHGVGSKCPAYETKTQHKVLERTSDRVKVQYTRDYGDATGCPKPVPPSRCTLDLIYTFKLLKKLCEPRCGITFVKGADAGVAPRCTCPDGGAP